MSHWITDSLDLFKRLIHSNMKQVTLLIESLTHLICSNGGFIQKQSRWPLLHHWLTQFIQIADSFRSVFNRKYLNLWNRAQYIQIKTDARDLTNKPEAVWWCRLPSRWPGPLYWPGSGSPGWRCSRPSEYESPVRSDTGPRSAPATAWPAWRTPSTAHKWLALAQCIDSNRSESVVLVLKG